MPAGDVQTLYENGQWLTRIEGVGGARARFETKAQAAEHGRKEALDRGVEHIIKNQDGTIAERNTYPRSADPRDIPG